MNLLAVDDEREVVEALKLRLDWGNIGIRQVDTAISAEEARKIMMEKRIDILLCDIEMPRENGLSLCQWAKERYPQLECIFLTSHAEFEYAREALLLGSCDYILQPASYKEIADSVGRAIEKIRQKREHTLLERQGREIMDSFRKLLEEQEQVAGRTGHSNENFAGNSTGYFNRDAVGNSAGHFSETPNISGREWLEHPKEARADYRTARGRNYDGNYEPVWNEIPGGFMETEDEDQERISKVISYIQNHLDQDLTRNELAEYVHLNPEYFSKYFKKQTGYLLKDYIMQEKMKLAKQLLANTNLSINMVATRIGYFNFSHFSKAFKKLEGMTPGEYRQAAKQR